ncbi:LLM class flavin-dependent oxidoreductase [Streptosporangium saharense]|uniref:LLM class flavin-dependent oxidoreductase n=1 Tax=Streptosporangium saharense TaxID=1706840 RepID=UPI0036BC483A
MTDYGHDLLFGVILTPDAHTPTGALDLAVLADEAGLDLVTVPDHPYRPDYLEAWTLLTAIATRTARIRVLPNVANLALRPPALLARAAATLDLLSGGRVELGLGAGGYADAIADEGGPRRTPGESLDALSEAVTVIRSLLTPGQPVNFDGVHHHLRDARPGPAHPHPIGLWLGTVGPRALRLTGRIADGWLPSATRIPPHALADANRVIDDAATAAGRRPADIRRLYNLPGLSGDVSSQLAALTLEHGTGGFLFFVDSPAQIRALATTVAPRTRDLVAEARAQNPPNRERAR